MVLLTPDQSSNRIAIIKIKNDLHNTLGYYILIVIRIDSFYLPNGMDYVLMMRCLRYVKVVIQILIYS